MGGRKINKGGSRNRKSIMRALSSIVEVPFNFVLPATFMAANTFSLAVRATTAFDNLLGNIANNFELYRISRLSFKSLAAGATYAFTYYPTNESSSVVDSFSAVSLAGLNRVVSANTTVSTYLTIPKPMLYQTPEDWYSTNTGSQITQQGRFVIATPASYTGTIYVQVTGICQFKAPSANGTDLKSVIPKPIMAPSESSKKDTTCFCSSTIPH